DYSFGGLGNALRKCRTDFGVRIRISLDEMKPKPGERCSHSHCAVGTIEYPAHGGAPASEGTLLYIKSSLTGDEPADLFQYSLRTPSFPQDSTADQWFDETRFESYRALGVHVGRRAFEALQEAAGKDDAARRMAEALWGA